jgi:hypothetical protein
MTVNRSSTSSQPCTSLCAAFGLIAFATSVSISGCRPTPPTSSTTPASEAAAATPKRVPVTTPLTVGRHLNFADADLKVDIASALNQARLEQKRIVLDFAGDWCDDHSGAVTDFLNRWKA